MTPDPYRAFLERKSRVVTPHGIDGLARHAWLDPFQHDLTAWALRRARAAIFADTGLGKTRMQLAWCDAVATHTDKPVLILTPLAVAAQTVEEAARIGLDGVAYAADQSQATTRIVVTNYDRFDKFDISLFGGIDLDESGIIKSHDSKTRIALTEACAGMAFKLCCTATPAPNDWTELGTHAEFLDVMTEKEMLATYFVHDGSGKAKGGDEWRLKGHAIDAFWGWVASWGAMVRTPADLGYDDARYVLPPMRKHLVRVDGSMAAKDGELFAMEASTLSERLTARKDSVADRAEAAAGIVNADPGVTWLIWCHLNAEADALRKLIPGAVEVRGTDDAEIKARRLLGFCHGDPLIMISKARIAGWGMNYQHCQRMVFVGLSDSFEQIYQAIRRCWRFGQQHPVDVYFIASVAEGNVVRNIEEKERAFVAMGQGMAVHMRDLTRRAVRGEATTPIVTKTTKQEMPRWMM